MRWNAPIKYHSSTWWNDVRRKLQQKKMSKITSKGKGILDLNALFWSSLAKMQYLSCSGKWTRRRDTSEMKSSCNTTCKTLVPCVTNTSKFGSLSKTFNAPAIMLNAAYTNNPNAEIRRSMSFKLLCSSMRNLSKETLQNPMRMARIVRISKAVCETSANRIAKTDNCGWRIRTKYKIKQINDPTSNKRPKKSPLEAPTQSTRVWDWANATARRLNITSKRLSKSSPVVDLKKRI